MCVLRVKDLGFKPQLGLPWATFVLIGIYHGLTVVLTVSYQKKRKLSVVFL